MFALEGGALYGGGFDYLGIQAVGVFSVAAWVAVTMGIVFFVLKKTVGLRVKKEEEIAGLDIEEHGLASSYADFMPVAIGTDFVNSHEKIVPGMEITEIDAAIPVVNTANPGAKMTNIVVLTKQSRFELLKTELDELGITGMTVTQVMGCGMQKGAEKYYRGVKVESTLLPKIKVEIVVCKVPVESVVNSIKKALYTGRIGDGKIFIYDVESVVKVRTGQIDYEALQDEI